MCQFGQFVRDFLRREDGPTAVEYAVMLALIIGVLFSAISAVGASTKGNFSKGNNAFVTGS